MREESEDLGLIRIVLAATMTVLGLQSTRVFFAHIAWYVRDTLQVATLDLVPIAFAPFLAVLVVGALARVVPVRPTLWATICALGLARVVLQLTDSPAIDIWASGVGVAAFFSTLPLFLALGRLTLVHGLLLGLTVDTALRGSLGTLDLPWRSGAGSVIITMALVLVVIDLLRRSLPHPVGRRGLRPSGGFAVLGLGPFLFVELVILQMPGWWSSVTGISPAAAPVVITVGNAAGLVLVHRHGLRWLGPLALLAAVAAAERPALAFWVAALAGLALGPTAWHAMVGEPEEERWWGSMVGLWGGGLLFLLAGLGYYLPLDLRLGFTSANARWAAGVLLVVLALLGTRQRPAGESAPSIVPAMGWLLVVLTTVPLTVRALERPSTEEGSFPIRAMSYNIHSGFDVDGRLDLEAIAAVIDESGADIIALQEVPRGRLINGGADALHVLQQAVGMPHAAFFGTSDPVWGNAILSRFEITTVERRYLPQVGTPLRRGSLLATIPIDGAPLHLISVHLQHINHPGAHDEDPEADLYPVHTEQIRVMLEQWEYRPRTVLAGDLNARPGWRQITELLQAGFVDAWAEAGSGPGYTSNTADPRYRIDWIVHTDDLIATDAEVIESTASDHFPVVAVIDVP